MHASAHWVNACTAIAARPGLRWCTAFPPFSAKSSETNASFRLHASTPALTLTPPPARAPPRCTVECMHFGLAAQNGAWHLGGCWRTHTVLPAATTFFSLSRYKHFLAASACSAPTPSYIITSSSLHPHHQATLSPPWPAAFASFSLHTKYLRETPRTTHLSSPCIHALHLPHTTGARPRSSSP